MNAILNPIPGDLVLVIAPQAGGQIMLDLIAHLACRGPLRILDGGNRFDAYGCNLAVARAYLEGQGPFPQRAALNQLAGRFLTEFYATVAQWVDWASAFVATWPDDVPEARFDPAAGQEAVALAESIEALLRVPPQMRSPDLQTKG